MTRSEASKSNITQLLLYRGISSYELSINLGYSRTYIDDFLRGRKQSITTEAAVKIAEALGVDIGYIFGSKELPATFDQLEEFQKGLRTANFEREPGEAPQDVELAVSAVDGRRVPSRNLDPGSIPEIDTRLGAGGGGYPLPAQVSDGSRTYSADTVRAEWRMPTSFLRDELHVNLATVDIAPVFGDSMTDERGGGFRDGDRVLINRADLQLRQGGIFAVRDADETIIKQVELVRGSDPPRIICTSLNPRYQPFELVLDGSAEIIGRVVLKISRI